jgi:ParB family chromosome partitioning protein
MRLGVIERLAGSRDARVSAALVRATQSDHDDLRLRAAELLAQRKDDLAAEVLAGFLRHDDDDTVEQARDALIVLGSVAAVAALGARLAELTEDDAAVTLIEALGRTGHPAAADVLIPYLVDGSEAVATAVLEAATALASAKVRDEDTEEEQDKKRDYALLVRVLRAASHAKEASARSSAATSLAKGPEAGQSEALTQFFTDRDKEVRAAAVDSYSQRVRNEGAPVDPLVPILRAGARDLMLSAAEGVAFKQGAGALRPLLLFVRAGESGERERAILALGSLGDLRALPELEIIAAGGTPEAPVEESMQLAAVEAFGRLFRAVTSPETRQRLLDRIEQAEANDSTEHQQAAIRALRYIGDERSRLRIEARTTRARSPSWYTRLEAVKNLVLLGDKASEMVLARALGDNDGDVRGEAKRGLLKLFPGEQTRVELHALLLGDDDLPTEAALYLAEKGEAETLLAKLPEVKDEEARSRLVFGLLRRPELKVSSLLLLLGQDKATNRDNAAWLIGARASGEGATALAASDRTALIAGLLAAEQRAAQGSKKLLGDERDAEIVAWRRTLWALRGVAAREALGRLRELAVATEEAAPGLVRQEATVGLATLGHDKADVEALKAALRDPDSGVRTAAAGGLAALVPEQAAALVLAVQPFDPVAFEVAVKRGAAGLLGTEPGRRVALPSVLVAHDTRAIKALLDGAKDDATLLDAIGAAGRCGGDELIASLTAIATDKKSRDVATRKAAYRALKRAKRQAEHQAKASKNHQEVAP